MSNTNCRHDGYRIATTYPPDSRTMTVKRMEWCDTCGKLLDEREWSIPSVSSIPDEPPAPTPPPTPEDYEALRKQVADLQQQLADVVAYVPDYNDTTPTPETRTPAQQSSVPWRTHAQGSHSRRTPTPGDPTIQETVGRKNRRLRKATERTRSTYRSTCRTDEQVPS